MLLLLIVTFVCFASCNDDIRVDPPKVVVINGYNPVFKGNSLTLSCVYEFNSGIVPKWNIKQDMEKIATIDGRTLVLNKIEENLNGEYLSCTLLNKNKNNAFVEKSVEYQIRVKGNSSAEKPQIYFSRADITEGSAVSATCDYFPIPNIEFSWNGPVALSTTRTSRTLSITKITRDFKWLSCSIRSEQDNRLLAMNVISPEINYMDVPVLSSSQNATWHITEGSNVTLYCNVDCFPRFPSYEFFKDGEIAKRRGNADEVFNSNKFYIGKASSEDTGHYTCRTVLPGLFSKTSARHFLRIQDKEDKKKIHPFVYVIAVLVPALLIVLACVFCKCKNATKCLTRTKSAPAIKFDNNNKKVSSLTSPDLQEEYRKRKLEETRQFTYNPYFVYES